MLQDLLDSGIYGGASGSRKHSSTMTLHAVAAQKQGKQKKMQIFRTIFPAAKELQGRYSYLQKKPFLLPLAWGDRLLHYRKESHTAVQSIQIGQKTDGTFTAIWHFKKIIRCVYQMLRPKKGIVRTAIWQYNKDVKRIA